MDRRESVAPRRRIEELRAAGSFFRSLRPFLVAAPRPRRESQSTRAAARGARADVREGPRAGSVRKSHEPVPETLRVGRDRLRRRLGDARDGGRGVDARAAVRGRGLRDAWGVQGQSATAAAGSRCGRSGGGLRQPADLPTVRGPNRGLERCGASDHRQPRPPRARKRLPRPLLRGRSGRGPAACHVAACTAREPSGSRSR